MGSLRFHPIRTSQLGGDIDATRADADERYRRLIDQSGLGLFQTDRDGHIAWVNDAAAKIVGYRSGPEFMAEVSDIRSIYVDPSRREDFLREVESKGAVSDFEYEIKRRDGSTRWISVSATSITRLDGSLEAFEGTVQDVTDRKLLEAAVSAMSSHLDPVEAASKFADVLRRVVPFQQLSLAVIEGSAYRRIVSISGDRQTSPLPRGEAVPLKDNSVSVVVAEQRPLVVQDTSAGQWLFDQTLNEAGVQSYAIFPLIDDDGVFATFNIGLDRAGGMTDEIVALLARHATAVAQAVKNVIIYEQQREVVAQLTELDHLKNEFFAAVAHDLRNPLSVVSGIAEILAADDDHLPAERRHQMMEMIASNVRLLNERLERDLEVALVQTGELHYDIAPFFVGAVVADTVEAFQESNPDRSFGLSIAEELPKGRGDARRHVQVLQNLLSNAVKYSPPGSTVTVTVGPSDGEIVVSVVDEGEGITEDQVTRLFRRMSRLERSKPGTGLGLYLAKAMVEAQGGRIWVESAGARGAKFSYTIPIEGSNQ